MTITDVVARLHDNDFFLILTHVRPDGDTVGSATALCSALQKSGKHAYLYNNPQFPDCYPWLSDDFVAPADYEYEYVIAVDTADTKMLPKGYDGKVDLCIDHHPTNTDYAGETYVEKNRAACGEIVLKIIKQYCGRLYPDVANALYVAISTDCGCFAYGNTNADTHRAAAELYDAGCEMQSLNKTLFRTSSKARITLEGLIYASLRYYHDGKTVIAVVTKEMLAQAGAKEKDCQDIAALPGRVEGALTSAVIKEVDGGHCKVSLRTTGEISASEVCQKFGGGGHVMASGCCLEMSPDEAAQTIADAVAEARGK